MGEEIGLMNDPEWLPSIRWRGSSVRRGLLAAAVMLVAVACGQNPVLGDWDIDRQETERSAVAAAEVTDLLTLTLRSDAIVAKDTEIPVSYIVEGDRVRLVREDGRGEHLIELLPDGRIRIELPVGVSAVYRRAGS
jgi:hypothetical protein